MRIPTVASLLVLVISASWLRKLSAVKDKSHGEMMMLGSK